MSLARWSSDASRARLVALSPRQAQHLSTGADPRTAKPKGADPRTAQRLRQRVPNVWGADPKTAIWRRRTCAHKRACAVKRTDGGADPRTALDRDGAICARAIPSHVASSMSLARWSSDASRARLVALSLRHAQRLSTGADPSTAQYLRQRVPNVWGADPKTAIWRRRTCKCAVKRTGGGADPKTAL